MDSGDAQNHHPTVPHKMCLRREDQEVAGFFQGLPNVMISEKMTAFIVDNFMHMESLVEDFVY
jgi:hypothetical protein